MEPLSYFDKFKSLIECFPLYARRLCDEAGLTIYEAKEQLHKKQIKIVENSNVIYLTSIWNVSETSR